MNKQYIIDKCGWFAGILLGICGFPEAYRAITAENYETSGLFLLIWGGGEVLMLIPALIEIKKPYLIMNLLLNIFFISVMTLRYTGLIGRLF